MNKRILQFAALAVLLLVGTGCQFLDKVASHMPSIKGVGPVKSEEKTVGSFDRVDIGGGFKVDLKIGPKESLKIDAQENILKEIRSDVKDGTLKVWTESSFETSEPIKVTITTPQLTAVDLSGACIGNLEGVSGDKFELKLSGASKLHVKGNAKNIALEASGASEAVWDNLAATSISVEESGACTVLLSGTADSITIDVNGASTLKAENLILKTASVQGSGASNLALNASERIEGQVSGATSLRHSGKANVSVQSDGGSSVSEMP